VRRFLIRYQHRILYAEALFTNAWNTQPAR